LDKHLLQKFFRNRCTPEEIEEVMEWFQTEEGARYFEENLDRDMLRYSDEENLLLYPHVPSEKLLKRIRHSKRLHHGNQKRSYGYLKAVAALVICAVLASGFFLMYPFEEPAGETAEIKYRLITTDDDQNRLVTLNDGTQIRLNANSGIKVPKDFPTGGRQINLYGEAWFEVTADEFQPFIIYADRALIEVLGTEFNVKADSAYGEVQVAVAKGKVALNSLNRYATESISAILTENTFAIYNSRYEDIIIENSPVDNYLSWISGRLYFYDDPLWVVSRYLERIYNVSIHIDDPALRGKTLSMDLARDDLEAVLDIISRTLGIRYEHSNESVLWTSHDQ
jgi:transmembrane sensor